MSDFDLVVRGNIVERDRIITDGWLAVREGRVAARGVGAAPSAREHVDARGMWVMPGVLDGELVLTGGGDLNVRVGGALNPNARATQQSDGSGSPTSSG